MSKYDRNPKLPKSSLIKISWHRHSWWFHTVRIANARSFWLLTRIEIIIRRPWLKHSAKALYPELSGGNQS